MAKASKVKEQAHIEYITSKISVRDLAKKYDVATSTMAKWIKAGDWTAERKGTVRKAEQKARKKSEQRKRKSEQEAARKSEQKVEQHIDAMADRLAFIYACADLGMDRVKELMQLDEGISPRDLNSLFDTLAKAKRDVYGITDDKTDNNDGVTRLIVDGGEELDA